MAFEQFCLGPDTANGLNFFCLNGPCHTGYVVRDSAVYLALKALNYLRPADIPPLLCGGHFFPGFCYQYFRKDGVGVCLALVIIGGARAALIGVKCVSYGFDTQLVHHVLVIFLGGECNWCLRIGCCAEQAAGKQNE